MSERPDIDAILARAEAATKGPWTSEKRWHSGKNIASMRSWSINLGVDTSLDGWWESSKLEPDLQSICNCDFIAHSREDIPALCQYVRELEAELKEVKTKMFADGAVAAINAIARRTQ